MAYFKTPFEDEGNLAIINGKFLFPEDSQYSRNLRDLISDMLNTDPIRRPNIFDVLDRVSAITKVSHGVTRKTLPYDAPKVVPTTPVKEPPPITRSITPPTSPSKNQGN